MGGVGHRGLGLAVSVSLLAPSVHAQTSQTFRWEAPADCPQSASFLGQVERLLGQTLDARRDQSLSVAATVTPGPEGYAVQLQVTSVHGTQQRQLTHRDCGELTEAAALVTALAIDPHLVVPTREPEPAASTAPEPAPLDEPGPSAEPAPRPTPPPATAPTAPTSGDRDSVPAKPTHLHGSITVIGLVGSTVLPDVGVGIGGMASLGSERFRAALSGSYWLPRFRGVESSSGPGVDLGAWGVSVKGCALPLTGEITLMACLGPVLGDMYGTGNELLENPTTQHERWAALEAELSLAITAKSGLTTLLGLQLGRTLEAPRFGILENRRSREVFAANDWTVNGFVGLGQFR